jgi:hypothetical protein
MAATLAIVSGAGAAPAQPAPKAAAAGRFGLPAQSAASFRPSWQTILASLGAQSDAASGTRQATNGATPAQEVRSGARATPVVPAARPQQFEAAMTAQPLSGARSLSALRSGEQATSIAAESSSSSLRETGNVHASDTKSSKSEAGSAEKTPGAKNSVAAQLPQAILSPLVAAPPASPPGNFVPAPLQPHARTRSSMPADPFPGAHAALAVAGQPGTALAPKVNSRSGAVSTAPGSDGSAGTSSRNIEPDLPASSLAPAALHSRNGKAEQGQLQAGSGGDAATGIVRDGAKEKTDAAAAQFLPATLVDTAKLSASGEARVLRAPRTSQSEAAPPADRPAGSGIEVSGAARVPAGEHVSFNIVPVNSQNSSPSTGSGAGPSAREPFAALDAGAGQGTSGWIHAGTHSAEAGFEDPALGWVGIRADLAAGSVHAAIVPESAEAAQALGSHMAGLHTYLNEQRATVETLTLAAPGNRGSDAGLSQSMQKGSEQCGEQKTGRGGSPEPRSEWQRPAVTGSISAVSNGAPSIAPPMGRAGMYISVMA